MKRNLLRSCILLLLSAVRPVLAAEPALILSLQPAWDGLMRPGASSEIGIRLLAPQGGRIALTLPDHQPPIRASAVLDAKVPQTVWIPVRPESDKPLRVEARLDEQPPVRSEVWLRAGASRTLVAAVLDGGMEFTAEPAVERDALELFQPSRSSLPRSVAGYAVIDVLVIDQANLTSLDRRQLKGLRAYLQGCGKLILVDTKPHWVDALVSRAGCGGRFVADARGASLTSEQLQTMVQEPTPQLPATTSLRSMLLQSQPARAWLPIAVFFLFYVLSLLLLARSIRQPAQLLLAPLSATLLSLMVWSNDSAERRLLSWSEMNSGDATARFTALLQVEGAGKGTATTALPVDLGIPRSLNTTFPVAVKYPDRSSSTLQLAVDSRLLSQHEFLLQGSSMVHLPLSVELTADGPLVTNTGSVPTMSGVLGWQGRRYPVPSLQPGERWRPPEQATPWNVAVTVERLLRARTASDTVAMLIPFRPSGMRRITPDVEESGWLLIRNS